MNDQGTDERTDDHWQHDAEDHPDALEGSGTGLRSVVTDRAVDQSGDDQIAAHHDDAGQNDSQRLAGTVHQQQADDLQDNGRNEEEISTGNVDDPAAQDGNRTGGQ